MSRDLAVALALSGDYTAEQRVAAFLVAMGERLGVGGSVRLPMARRDIASYLRLATETVCRVLGRLEDSGRIVNENKTVRMVDAARLRFLAGPVNLAPVLHAA
jgi:CRP/FNR family transcriptional regulator